MSDPLSFLDDEGAEGTTTATTETPGAGETTQPTTEGEAQAEGADTTTSTGSQEEPAGGAAAAGTQEKKKEGEAGEDKTHVPLATYLDEREKRKEAEKKLSEREAAEPDMEFTAPDPKEDPEGYAQYTQQVQVLTTVNERLNFSEKFARKEHGDEVVDKVKAWTTAKFEEDPAFAQRILFDADPYEAALKEYNDDQLRGQTQGMTPEEIEEFKAWKASKAGGGSTTQNNGGAAVTTQPAASAAKPQPAVETPPTTINGESAAGGAHSIPIGPGQAFDSIFAN